MEQHKTTDIQLVSALLVKGYKLLKISDIGHGKAEFTVTRSIELDEPIERMIDAFQDREMMVDAKTLFESLRNLKTRTNDFLRNSY